ncbi:SMC-Scp complex subunit ScpB [Guggenheimella bovis]
MLELVRKLEVLLFTARAPMKRNRLQSLLETDKMGLQNAIELLRKEYAEGKKGITVLEFGNEVQLATNDRYEDLVRVALDLTDDKGLGPSTLEVLSIIAYKQPVTKIDIDHLRGVNSDYSIRDLVGRGLIEVCGTLETLGSPKLYRTTSTFLRDFRLESLADLPKVEE